MYKNSISTVFYELYTCGCTALQSHCKINAAKKYLLTGVLCVTSNVFMPEILATYVIRLERHLRQVIVRNSETAFDISSDKLPALANICVTNSRAVKYDLPKEVAVRPRIVRDLGYSTT